MPSLVLILLQPSQCDVAQHRQILPGGGLTHAGIILAKGHIERPMQFVLNAPVIAHGAGETSCVGADATDEEVRFAGGFAIDRAPCRSCSCLATGRCAAPRRGPPDLLLAMEKIRNMLGRAVFLDVAA